MRNTKEEENMLAEKLKKDYVKVKGVAFAPAKYQVFPCEKSFMLPISKR